MWTGQPRPLGPSMALLGECQASLYIFRCQQLLLAELFERFAMGPKCVTNGALAIGKPCPPPHHGCSRLCSATNFLLHCHQSPVASLVIRLAHPGMTNPSWSLRQPSMDCAGAAPEQHSSGMRAHTLFGVSSPHELELFLLRVTISNDLCSLDNCTP